MRQPGLDAARYRLALRRAEAARDLAHPGFYFRFPHASTQIGIAHYRLGEYRPAVEALTASEAYYAADPHYRDTMGTPWNLAFLVMAHHQLGEKETAGAMLARLHRFMKDSRWASRDDLQTFVREAEELCVWGAPPRTDEERKLRREAAALVNELPAELGFKDEILAYLRTRDSLSEPLRQHALTMAGYLQEEPFRLNVASSELARRPGQDAARYRLALRQAEAARDLAPPGFVSNPYYRPNTQVGIAHYRLGEYREAVEALTASEASYAAANVYKSGTPWNLAFLAMAHHRLGQSKRPHRPSWPGCGKS